MYSWEGDLDMSEPTASSIKETILDIIVGIGRLQGIGMGSEAPELDGFRKLLVQAQADYEELRRGGLLHADEVREFNESFLNLAEGIEEFAQGCCVEA